MDVVEFQIATTSAYAAAEMSAEAGIVIIQAHTILLATPHLTEPEPMVAPDPITDPLTT